MFDKIFKGNQSRPEAEKPSPKTENTAPMDPQTESLLRVIAEKKKEDPQIGLKIGAQEINTRLMAALKNEKGVHIESFLSVLAALAGFACQMSVREEFVRTGKLSEDQAFTIVGTKDGKRFFFGDLLNKPLAENPYSVWGLAGGAAQQAGCNQLPDVKEIFSYVSTTVGEKEFGIPRIPEGHRPSDLPVNYVKALWPKLLPVVTMFCDSPSEWPILYSMAIYKAIDMAKTALNPGLAVRIVMETAIPMSKIDPAELWPS